MKPSLESASPNAWLEGQYFLPIISSSNISSCSSSNNSSFSSSSSSTKYIIKYFFCNTGTWSSSVTSNGIRSNFKTPGNKITAEESLGTKFLSFMSWLRCLIFDFYFTFIWPIAQNQDSVVNPIRWRKAENPDLWVCKKIWQCCKMTFQFYKNGQTMTSSWRHQHPTVITKWQVFFPINYFF